LSVGLVFGGLQEIKNHCTDTHIPTNHRFFCVVLSLRLGGPDTLKAYGKIFGNCLQNKRCSAGRKDSYGKFGPDPTSNSTPGPVGWGAKNSSTDQETVKGATHPKEVRGSSQLQVNQKHYKVGLTLKE